MKKLVFLLLLLLSVFVYGAVSPPAVPSGTSQVATNSLQNVTYLREAANISNAFANAVSGQTFIFDTGTNDIRGTLPTELNGFQFVDHKLSNVHNIRLLGSGNTVFNVTNGGIGFSLQQCTNVYIAGITFRSVKTNGTTYDASVVFRHGTVSGWGTNSGVVFENCRWESGNEFGLCAMSDGGGYQILWQDLQVSKCVFYQVGHTNYSVGQNPDGGAVGFHPNIVMQGCVVEECGRGVECYSGTQMSYNCIVRDTEFRNNWARGIHAQQSAFATRWLIDGCHFTANASARIRQSHISMITAESAMIANCTFTNFPSGDYAVTTDSGAIGAVRNVSVVNCTFSDLPSPVSFHNTIGGRIAGNVFQRCGPVQLSGDAPLVEQNYFLNCGTTGEPVVWGRFYPGTNCVVRNNWFVRKSGTAPSAWVAFESTYINSRVYGNQYQDVSAAVPLLNDAGVGTVRLAGEQLLTNSTATAFTNLNAAGTLTNLANVSVPAHSLTNNDRSIVGYWAGNLQNAAANTNQFQIVFGSETILDTGLQIASNGNWRAGVTISRSSSGTAQLAEGWLEWNVAGAPFRGTNSVVTIAQTNGIATVLALKHGARRGGAATNTVFRAVVSGIEP